MTQEISADETTAVRMRYARRQGDEQRYSLLDAAALLELQERQRALRDLFVSLGKRSLSELRLLEVGCGSGANLLEFLRFGFLPDNLRGIELLDVSAEQARRKLPDTVRIITGDAVQLASSFPAGSQDIVYQSTVFSSLLDDEFQQRLADVMWGWVRPGGGVLWYDFTMNNPLNADVRGVPIARIRELFPSGRTRARRLTLAPPLARVLTSIAPSLWTLFNLSPLLRTHVLVWIEKPSEQALSPMRGRV